MAFVRYCALDGADNKVHLYNLPVVVIWEIVDLLDVPTLKILRQVSHRAKSWVERAATLRRMEIIIRNRRRADEILESFVPWNHFTISIANEACNVTTFVTLKLLQRFGKDLIKIKLDFIREKDGCLTDMLMNVGPQLEHLDFVGSVLDSYRHVSSTGPLTPYEEARLPKENFAQLQYLNLQVRGINENSVQLLSSMISLLLRNCPNLLTLKLPIGFQSNNFDVDIEPNDSDGKNLVKFLSRRTRWRSSQSTKFSLDFCADHEFQNNGKVAIYPCPIRTTNLMKLTKICQTIRGQLHHVPSSAFPSYQSNAPTLKAQEKDCLNHYIKSILCINFMITEIGNLYIPPSPILIVNITMEESRRDDYSAFNLPTSANVTSITLQNMTTVDIKGRNNLGRQLLCTYRPTLIGLKVVIADYSGRNWRRQLDALFPNLRKLYLGSTMLAERFVRLFSDLNMPHLEDVTFDNVGLNLYHMLTENVSQSTVAVFKRLKHLTLINVGLETIRDYTFIHLFSLMTPKTFIFRPRGFANIELLTFKEGVSTLKRIRGGFKDTIENFECIVPYKSSIDEMEELTSHFKNLKNLSIVIP